MLKQAIFLIFTLVCSVGVNAGVFGVRAYFEPQDNFNDMVGIRYKFRLDENIFETSAKIIFNASRFYNPDNYLEGYHAAIETNFVNYLSKLPDNYTDLGCTTSGGRGYPAGTRALEGVGSVIVGIVDWWKDFPEYHGRVGLNSLGQTLFPTFYTTVESVDGLTKSTAESQVNMTGKDVQLELVRGETFTSHSDEWGAHWLIDFVNGGQYCEDSLQPNTQYRKWYLTLTIDGMAYRFQIAVFEKAGRYLLPKDMVSLRTEFFEFDGYFRAYYWDFEVISEESDIWIPLVTFEMPEHIFDPESNRDYGPKFAIHDGHYVLELSNDHTGSIEEDGTYFQKDDVFTFPAPSTIHTLPTINWDLPVVTASENQRVVNIAATLDFPAPSDIKAAVSKRETGKPIEHYLLTIPAGERAGQLTLALEDDTVKQPDRKIAFVFDSSSTAIFGDQRQMMLNVIDDDPVNDAPTAPSITAIPGLSCTTMSPRWSAATDASGPIVSYNIYRESSNNEYVLVRQVDGNLDKTVDRVPVPGFYTYAVSAVDVFGLEGPKSQPFTSVTPACSADSVPPTGTISTPVDGLVIGGLVVVDVDVSDDDPLGVNSVDLYLDDNIYLDTIFLNLDQSFLLDTVKLTEGQHTLFIRTHDFGGNVHQSAPVNVTVSHRIPSVPSGLSLSSINADIIELEWDIPPLSEVGLVDHYEIVRDGNLVDTTLQNYYLDTNNTSGESHCYAVVAVSYSGVSSGLSYGACTDSLQIVGDLDGDADVDINDLSIILAARNTPAKGPDDPRDLDGDAQITVLDARKLSLLCTRPRCAAD